MKYIGLKPYGINEIGNSVQVTGSLDVTSGITGSLYGTSSWALNTITSSYSYIAETANFVLGTALEGVYAKKTFTNQTTWSFDHYLGFDYVAVQIFDSNNDVVIPTRINIVDQNTLNIYFTTPQTGTAIAALGNGVIKAGAYATTGSNTFVGTQIISGSLIVTNTITELSTRKIKENIQSISNQLDNIVKLNPVTYILKETHQSQIGLISEEVKQIYPEFVMNDGINYSKMVSVLISAIKELKQEIDQNKKEIEQLRHSNAYLSKE